jgi:hypothetical protein
LAAALIVGCGASESGQGSDQRPQQAGQPLDPARTAARLAGVRVAAITGDQEGVQRNVHALSEDLRRSMKIPDSGRRIDAEQARRVVLALPGVRTVSWIDGSNLLVRVEGAHLRTHRTIDQVCLGLEPLGDTLAVVVHVQNAIARTGEEMDTLSRNCQLAEGDYAFLQRRRRIDVLDPAVREQHRVNAEAARSRGSGEQTAGDQAALEAIPEM